jgi:hypothetical protein
MPDTKQLEERLKARLAQLLARSRNLEDDLRHPREAN